MAYSLRLSALALAALLAVPTEGLAQYGRGDRGGWQGDRGRHEGWRGPPRRGYGYGRGGPGYARRGNDVAPLIGGALLGLGLGAVLGGALSPAPGYAAPAPQYVPPPPAYYAPGKPGPGPYGY